MNLNGNSKKNVSQSEFIVDSVCELLRENKISENSKFRLELSSSIVKHLYYLAIYYDNHIYTREICLDSDPFTPTFVQVSIKRALRKKFKFEKITERNFGARSIRFE